jgi:hypothetical protein
MYVRMGMGFVGKMRGGGNRKGRTGLCGEGESERQNRE